MSVLRKAARKGRWDLGYVFVSLGLRHRHRHTPGGATGSPSAQAPDDPIKQASTSSSQHGRRSCSLEKLRTP